MMPDDATAVPVDDCCQVHVPMRHRDVGDVDRPHLVRKGRGVVSQQIWHDSLLEITLGKVRLGIDGVDPHLLHQAAHCLAADLHAILLQPCNKLAGAEIRAPSMPGINTGHNGLVEGRSFAHRLVWRIEQAGAVQPQQGALTAYGQGTTLLDHIPGCLGGELQLGESSPEESRVRASAGRWS